ncbi:thiamine pyrophosphate-binding protein [Haladaptatus sp. ZSTT2]|uniref:thiamine pyrophosphate-binding protein n=1 Tax=Haladaptatus sp. ZSTT2 TaxID=3120515 RepID=UPI00300F478D
MDGASVLVETLERAGVSQAFGVVGTTVLSILDKMADSEVSYVSTRHEQTAAGMAAAYAMATREPTVSISHVGPGAANQVIGVAAAFRDEIPVVSITGNEPSTVLGTDYNHEWDVMGVFDEFTKHGVQLTEAQFGRQARMALLQAVSGMPGPVHIDVPKDVSDAEVSPLDERSRTVLRERDFHATPTRARPDSESVAAVRDHLLDAERPLIIAGTDVRWTESAPALREFAERLQIPVATSQSARGAFPESHELSLGPVAHGSIDAGNEYAKSADLVISIGARFSDLTTDDWQLIAADAVIVHATLRARELDRHYVADVSTLADPGSFCADALDAVAEDDVRFASEAKAACVAFDEARRDLLEPGPELPDRVDPRRVIAAVEKHADDFAYTTGGGVHNTFPRLLPVDDLRGYFGTRNFTGMSQGLPLGLGAQLALDRQVIAFEGDGGFAMVMQDLETAVREDIPLKIIILNNDAYMSHAVRQEEHYGGRYVGTKYTNPAFDAIAREFGMFGEAVETDADVDAAVERLLAVDGPGLLDVHVDPYIGS